MTYRDESATSAKNDQLVAQRDHALARVSKLEADLAEARTWLKSRREPSRRASHVVAWGGYGSLGGSLLGTLLWATLGNPVLVPLAAAVGAVLVGLGALSAKNAEDGTDVDPPPPTID